MLKQKKNLVLGAIAALVGIIAIALFLIPRGSVEKLDAETQAKLDEANKKYLEDLSHNPPADAPEVPVKKNARLGVSE